MNNPSNSTFFREKEPDLRVSTDAEKKQLFASEASAYRKQPRDDIHLDTVEPPEGVLQYRTDPVSPYRMPFIEERATQRRVDREEKRRLEAELEADMRAYEPWGRGGEEEDILSLTVERNRDVEGGRGSVLLSESEFIDQNGIAFPVPPDVERKSAKLSARERRRLANLQSAERKPVQLQSYNMRKLRDTNTPRMKRFPAFGQHNTTARGCSDDDDEASRGDECFALQSPGRPSSIDTATTEPWIRAESSDTLRRLMSASELQDRPLHT